MKSNEYAAYLRKSRADMDAEAHGDGETLARHEKLLMETARKLGITITAFYREIVSGDSIASRPQMQQLLNDVESGRWAGVLVVDVTRLARGDTIDQGIVAQSFKYSNTKIITPVKTYDPSNEYDEEYFEFGLFMSRREYKMINQRQQRGRIASVNEGKWCANKAPYGYRRVKLEHEKGYTLEPDEHADVVRDIFRWFTGAGCERIGSSLIARRLDEAGIPSPVGRNWLPSCILNMLRNPAYAGWIRWGGRPSRKVYQDGELKLTRPRASDAKISKGRHDAIISQEAFDRAQQILSANKSRPGPKQAATKNPLSGLIICSECGRSMVRRPYTSGYPDGLLCPYTSCHNVSSRLEDVERTLLDSMRLWLASFERESKNGSFEDPELDTLRRTLSASNAELDKLLKQLDRAYDLVEQGVYSPDVFLDRSRRIASRRSEIEESIEKLQSEIDTRERIQLARSEIAPQMRHVLDSYPAAKTAEEKNALLKSVLEKAVYTKKQRDRWGGEGMTLEIFPLLPHF